MNFTRGTEAEFGAAMPGYAAKVAELVSMGFAGERETIRGWERKYGVPIFTSGQNHVRALRTLGVSKFVGVSYFPERLNAVFARYFMEAGFRLLAMEGMQVPFADVPELPPEEIHDYIKARFEQHRDAEAIYMLGSAWKTVGIIDRLEKDTGLTVVHAGPARCWETQLRLGLRHPITGYGKLLAEMPA
jgi:maleate cis-trans isomerase